MDVEEDHEQLSYFPRAFPTMAREEPVFGK